MSDVPHNWVALNKRNSLPHRISKSRGQKEYGPSETLKWHRSLPVPACGGGHLSLPVPLHYSSPCLRHHMAFLISVSLLLCPHFPFLIRTPVILDEKPPLYSSMSSDELISSSDVLRYWELGLEHTILEDHLICNRDRETKEKSFWDSGGRQKGAVDHLFSF